MEYELIGEKPGDEANDKPKKSSEDWEKIHKEALAQFELCKSANADNREAALEDLKFWRLGELKRG